jgi:cell division septum initiation protein DivIVA
MLQQKHQFLADEILAEEGYSSILGDPRTQRFIDRVVETEVAPATLESLDVLAAIECLETRILQSPRVPLTGKTMVNEEELLEQLDSIRLNLPEIVVTAHEIVSYKEHLIQAAQQQAQQIIAEANQRAYQVANELGIIDRAEQEARQIEQIAIAECDRLRQQTIAEAQRLSELNSQEMERLRARVMSECQQVQDGADAYADRVLHEMEDRLTDILNVIQRGRNRLNPESTGTNPQQKPQQQISPSPR